MSANQSDHHSGLSANEAAASAAVTPRAMARFRHSRRTANQRSPTPGVTFVRSGIAHSHGRPKPRTIAAVTTTLNWPISSSREIGKRRISQIRGHGRPSQAASPTIVAAQRAMKTGWGRLPMTPKTRAATGVYRKLPVRPTLAAP